MTKRLSSSPPQDHQRSSRPRRTGLAPVGLASLAFVLSACGSASPSVSPTTASAGTGQSNTGTGPVTRPGPQAGTEPGGKETTGSYSVAFAECMRAHGVPKFPNPEGSGGQLGPGSGVNPASAVYGAALNGPCRPLAPAGWVSPGPVTK
jgi:hypothetical protein